METLNAKLKQVHSQRSLGVIIDDEFRLDEHIEMISASAIKALNGLRNIFLNASTDVSIIMYKAKVRSLLESTYPIWCSVDEKAMKKIERVQRIALLKISGAMNSTSTAVLEKLLHVMPLRIRLEEVLVMFYAKTRQLADDNHLKVIMNEVTENNLRNQCTIMKNRLKEYPEVVSKAPILKITMPDFSLQKAPDIYINKTKYGSAGKRTMEQKNLALADAKKRIIELPDKQPVYFTDGSALNNPGPCGAAAVLYRDGMISTPIPSGKAVCRYGTSYLGELNGLDMAISDIASINADDITEVNILCDCEAAILSTQNTAMYNSAKELKNIRENTMKLHKKGINVIISHVPGHVNLIPNEIADVTAKEAAKEAINAGEGSVDLQLIKKTVRKVAQKSGIDTGEIPVTLT